VIEVNKKFSLICPTLIDSGNGYHLLYKIKPQQITDERKVAQANLVDKIINLTKNPYFKIDRLIDYTRIFSLPTTLHPKLKTEVTLLELNTAINPLRLKSEKPKINVNANSQVQVQHETTNIEEVLEYQVLLKNPPDGELQRHIYVMFPLKIWMRDTNYANHKQVSNIATSILGRPENCDPKRISKTAVYSRGVIIKYLRHNKDWAIKNGFEKYVNNNDSNIKI
jgi:hypothetical protein